MPSLKTYETPRIRQLSVGPVGKHRVIDLATVGERHYLFDPEKITAKYGSPVFVVSEVTLRENYRRFFNAFKTNDIKSVIGYSYKTNYLPAICSVLAGEGALAEVVSGMEYKLARSLGVNGADIIFNGPYKTHQELCDAIYDGALINIDGFDDLGSVEAACNVVNRDARIGLRINFHANNQLNWSKFGFSLEHGEAEEAILRVANNSRLKLEALHNHSGTFHVDPAVYTLAIRALSKVARIARREGLHPSVIDLGGGFPSQNALNESFSSLSNPGVKGDRVDEFAAVILKAIKSSRGAFGPNPTLILEPGRAIVDSAVQLISSVVATKQEGGTGRSIVVDAGVNILPTAYWYDHNLSVPDDSLHIGLSPTRVYGPLCMQIDIIRDNVLLPELSVGDLIVIDNVGAYCITQSMQFIQPRPAVVLLDDQGKGSVIRKCENWRDVFRLDSVPNRLRQDGYEF
jgi:diaminopimelate decarboxylase